jgi:hypothetical protein
MVGLGENSLVELMKQRKKEYFSVLVNHELVIPAREYIYKQTPAARLISFTNLSLHPQKKT